MIEQQENYLTVKEFAKLVHYSDRRIRQMINDGNIAANRIPKSRKLLIPTSELERIKKEAEQVFRADLLAVKTTQKEYDNRSRSYDRERFVRSDRIMNAMDLLQLLDTLRDENSYATSDFKKVIRLVSFFTLLSHA